MFKKIIIGILLVTVIGAGASMLVYRAYAGDDETVSSISPLNDQQELSPVQQNSQQMNAQENMGQPWQADGTITDLDETGFTLTTENGDFYIELSPTDYWQAQAATLEIGAQVSVEGTENAGMIHAFNVTISEDQELQLRTEEGQPLWSGGVDNSRGQNRGGDTGQVDGERSPEPQVQIDEWVTINGTLMAFQGGNMTVSTAEGDLLSIQTGQPRFFAGQGVSFVVGDEVTLVGYYEGGQFIAGDITQTSTGARVMLRDPNGRPLWAGPGNGNGKGGNNH